MLEKGKPLFPADFEVSYKVLTPEEGSKRNGLLFQGLRCDWAYGIDDIEKTGIWMINPEFEDADGNIIPYGEKASAQGTALMYILSPQMRKEVHWKRIQLGTKGFFMEGKRKIAEATVIKIIGLYENPTKYTDNLLTQKMAGIIKPTWKYLGKTFVGKPFYIKSINIWEVKWQSLHYNVLLPDHDFLYFLRQSYLLPQRYFNYDVYELVSKEEIIRFAAAEGPYGVWRFYLWD